MSRLLATAVSRKGSGAQRTERSFDYSDPARRYTHVRGACGASQIAGIGRRAHGRYIIRVFAATISGLRADDLVGCEQ